MDKNTFELIIRNHEIERKINDNRKQLRELSSSIVAGSEPLKAIEDECSMLNIYIFLYLCFLFR